MFLKNQAINKIVEAISPEIPESRGAGFTGLGLTVSSGMRGWTAQAGRYELGEWTLLGAAKGASKEEALRALLLALADTV